MKGARSIAVLLISAPAPVQTKGSGFRVQGLEFRATSATWQPAQLLPNRATACSCCKVALRRGACVLGLSAGVSGAAEMALHAEASRARWSGQQTVKLELVGGRQYLLHISRRVASDAAGPHPVCQAWPVPCLLQSVQELHRAASRSQACRNSPQQPHYCARRPSSACRIQGTFICHFPSPPPPSLQLPVPCLHVVGADTWHHSPPWIMYHQPMYGEWKPPGR